MRSKKFLIQIIALCILLLHCFSVAAQEPETNFEEPAVTIKQKKATDFSYDYRHFSKTRMETLKQQKEFQYDEAKVQEEIRAAIERENKRTGKKRNNRNKESKNKESKKDANSKDSIAVGSSLNWTIILVIFAVLVLVLLFALGFKPDSLFRKNTKKPETSETATETEEDIHTMELESALDKAIRLQNYKLAVRILYLGILKKLAEKGSIAWRTNKTNWDYVRELKTASLQPDFRKITNTFDYVWYGDFALDSATYKLIEAKMNLFKQRI